VGRRWAQLARRGRGTVADRVRSAFRPGLQIAKTTLAAVLAFVVADWIGTSTAPVLAPLTALLVVQVTTYQTVAQSLQRVASVVAGVLVAVVVAGVIGLNWWSLGAVVAVSLVLGGLLRLGPQLLEVPISAMLVLAVGGASEVAESRVYETLIGAVVGVLTNVLIAPPLYLQPAGEALGRLADRLARFMREQAAALRRSWSRADADYWLSEARALGDEVGHADRVLGRTEESARLNPRAGPTRRVQPRLRAALTGLDRCYLSLRELSRALLDRTYFVPPDEEATAYGEDVRAALADVLDAAADAVNVAGEIASAPGEPSEADTDRVVPHLDELRRRRDLLSKLVLVDPLADPAAWEQHGALLTAVDRLRVEVEAAARRPDQTWHPPLLTDRQREAIRRLREERWWRRGRPQRDG
jgi:hypothetical protein